MQRYVIILNPVAGKGNALKRRPEIEDFFRKHKLVYEIILTEHPGHGILLAEQYGTRSGTVVIAAGGDGTSNEVINGLMHAAAKTENKTPVFGVLAVGRGNDFAYGANIPAELGKDLLRIKDGKAVSMDVGEVRGGDYPDGRFFGNGVGIGFDTLVGLAAAKMNHIRGGFAYTLGALKTLIEYPEAPEIKITCGEKSFFISPALVSVMNGRRMGGSFFMAPHAEMDDGLFDICMTRQGKRRQLLAAMIDYGKGEQEKRQDTVTARAAHVEIEALSGSLAVHADGETICEAGERLEIINHQHALKIIEV